jgi:apolipoprotein N-acyltransferase
MNDPRHPRADLRVTRDWLAGRPLRGVLVVVLFAVAGVASVEGWLRWTAAPLRFGFAGLCALAALATVWAVVSPRSADRR